MRTSQCAYPAEVTSAIAAGYLLTRGARDRNWEIFQALYMAHCRHEGKPYIELKHYQDGRLDLEFYPVGSGMVKANSAPFPTD